MKHYESEAKRSTKLPVIAESIPTVNIVNNIDGQPLSSVAMFFQKLHEKLTAEGYHRLRLEVDYKYDEVFNLSDIALKVVGCKQKRERRKNVQKVLDTCE